MTEKEFNDRALGTALDPNTNLPYNKVATSTKGEPVQPRTMSEKEFDILQKYSPRPHSYLPTGQEGLDPTDYSFQLKNNADNRELRAQNQSNTELIFHGLTRLVGDTGLKMLEGAGYIGSSIGALASGNINVMLDNAFSEQVKDWSEQMHEALPVYKTNKYLQGNIWDQMGTLGFWADDFVDGLAFFASAWAAGGIYNYLAKGVGTFSKLGKVFNSSLQKAKLFKPTINSGINIAKFANTMDFLTLGTYQIASEAAFEAKDLKDQYINANWKRVQESTQEADKVMAEARSAAYNTFKWNAVALAPSNLLELSFMFKKFNIFKTGGKSVLKAGGAGVKDLTKLTTKDLAASFIGNSVITAIAEGPYEENIQYAIQRFNMDRSNNFNFNEPFSNQIKSVFHNMIDNFSDDEGLKNIVLGSLIGWLPGGFGGMNRTIETNKLENAKKKLMGTKIAGAKGFLNKYFKSEPILDKEGKATGSYGLILNKDGDTIFDDEAMSMSVLEAISKNANFASLVKALGTGNELLAHYGITTDFASRIIELAASGISIEDAVDFIEFEYNGELEELAKQGYKGNLDEVRDVYEEQKENVKKWYKIYDSINNKHAGTYDFGNTKEDVIKREMVVSEQFTEAVFQDYWKDKKDKIKEELSDLEGDVIVELLTDLYKDTEDEDILGITTYSSVLSNIQKSEKKLADLKNKKETVEGEAKENIQTRIEAEENNLEKQQERLTKVEQRYLKKFRQSTPKQENNRKLEEVYDEMSDIQEALASKEVDSATKKDLQKKLKQKKVEKERLEAKENALLKSSNELRNIILEGPTDEYSKRTLQEFKKELTYRQVASVFMDETMSSASQAKVLDLLNKQFEIEDILEASYERMKELMDEEALFTEWETFKRLREEEKKKDEVEPSTGSKESQESVGATIIDKEGKPVHILTFTPEDAKKYGYKVHKVKSVVEAKRRGESIEGDVKPSVYTKQEDQRYHYIYTDGTTTATITREVDFITRKARDTEEKSNEKIIFEFNNNKLVGIKYSKKGGKDVYTLPKEKLPKNNGKAYTKDTFTELLNALDTYLKGYVLTEGQEKAVIPTTTPEERAKALKEAREAKASNIIETYWASDEYDNTTPKRVFIDNNITKWFQGFFKNRFGIVLKENDNLVFIPFKNKGEGVVMDRIKKIVIGPADTEQTFKTLGIKAAKDSFVNVQFSTNGKIITIEGIEFINDYYKVTDAIVEDNKGMPVQVKLRGKDGRVYTFTDPEIVEAVAYGILLSDIVFEQVYDDIFAENKETPLVVSDNKGREYLVWYKDGEFIIHRKEDYSLIYRTDYEYNHVVDQLKEATLEKVQELISKKLFTYRKQLNKERDEVRRINTVLRSANPEEALRAATKSEVRSPKGAEKRATENIEFENDAEILIAIEILNEEINAKKALLSQLWKAINEYNKEIAKSKPAILKIERSLKKATDSLNSLKTQLDDLYKKREDFKQKNEEKGNFEKEILDLTKELETLAGQLENANIEVKTARRIVLTINNRLARLGKKKKSAATVKKLKANLKEAKSILNEKQDVFDSINTAYNELVKDLKTYIDKLQNPGNLEGEIQKLKDEIQLGSDILATIPPAEFLTTEKKNELETLQALHLETKRDIESLKQELESQKEQVKSYEEKVKGTLAKKLADKKKVEEVKKKEDKSKETETRVLIKIEGGKVEILNPEEEPDEAYTEVVVHSNGISHSATAISYVTFDRVAFKYESRNIPLEEHAINNGTEGDSVIPYFKVRGEDAKDDAEVLKVWRNLKLEDVRAKIEAGEELTQAEKDRLLEATESRSYTSAVDLLPIGLVYKTAKGEEIKGGLSYHNSTFPIKIPMRIKVLEKKNAKEYISEFSKYTTTIYAETRKARAQIIEALSNNNEISIDVTDISRGRPNNTGSQVPLADILKKVDKNVDLRTVNLGVAISNGLIRFQTEEASYVFGTPGNVFLKTNNTANGQEGILKLNMAKISKEHAALVLKVLQETYTKGQGGFSQRYENKVDEKFPVEVPVVEGTLTRREILDLLLYQGESSTKIDPKDIKRKHLLDKQLYATKENGKMILVYGRNKMPLYSKEAKDVNSFIDWAATNKNYNISRKLLGKKLESGSFKISNLEYDAKVDNYTSMLLKNGLIKTDVDVYKGTTSLFKNPAIVIDPSSAGIKITLSVEEEADLIVPRGKVITSERPSKPKSPEAVKSSSEIENKETKKVVKKVVERETGAVNGQSLNKTFSTLVDKPVGTEVYLEIASEVLQDGTVIGLQKKQIGKIVEKRSKRVFETSKEHVKEFNIKMLIDAVSAMHLNFDDMSEKDIISKEGMLKSFLGSAKYNAPAGRVKVAEKTKPAEDLSNLPELPDYIGEQYEEGPEMPAAPPTETPTETTTGGRLRASDIRKRAKEEVPAEDSFTDIPAEEEDTVPPFMEEPEEKKKGSGTSSTDINDLFFTDGIFRTTSNTPHQYKKGNFSEAEEWLKAKFGEEVGVILHKGLIRAGGSKRAFGKLLKDGFLLSDKMEVGTEYHEAFHRVSLFYLDPKDRTSLYKAAKSKYSDLKEATDKEVEEFLAEKFRDFILEKKSTKRLGLIKKMGRAITKFFSKLWNAIKAFIWNTDGSRVEEYNIQQLFNRVDQGYYKNFNTLDENISEAEKKYGKDFDVYRMLEIDGVELEHVSSEEHFVEVVQNLFFLLIKQNNLISKDEQGKAVLNISSIDDIKTIKYDALFNELNRLIDNGISISINLSDQLSKLEKNPGNPTLIQAIKSTLFKGLAVKDEDLETLIQNRIAQSNNLVDAYSEIIDKKDIFLDHLEDLMADVNIKTNRANLGEIIDEADVYENETEDISQIATWNEVVFKFSQKDNTATMTKLMLSLLPEDNQINTATGMIKFVPFGIMWERAMSDFIDVTTAEELMTSLEVLAEGSIPYTVLHRHLSNNEELKTQFLRTVRKYKLDFVNAMLDITDEKKGVKFRFIGAAVQTLAKRHLDEWGQMFTLNSPMFTVTKNHKVIPNKKALEKVQEEYNSLSRNISKEYGSFKNLPSLEKHKTDLLVILGEIGITMGPKELNSVLREIGVDPSLSLLKLVNGATGFDTSLTYIFNEKYGTLSKMFRGDFEKDAKGNYKRFEDAFKNEQGLRWLAEQIAKNNSAELGYSVLGPAGNRYYTIMQNTYLTDILNVYKHFSEDSNGNVNSLLTEESVYSANSDIREKLLTDADFRANFKLKTLSAYIVEEQGDIGREYQSITDIEEFLLRINAVNRGLLMLPTPADRKFIFFFDGLAKLDTYFDVDKQIPSKVIEKFMGYAEDEDNRVTLTKAQVDQAIEGEFLFEELVENLHYLPKNSKGEFIGKGHKVRSGEVILTKDGVAKVRSVLKSTGKLLKEGDKYTGRGTLHTHFKSYNRATLFEDIKGYLEDRLQDEIKKADELGIIIADRNKQGKLEVAGNILLDASVIKHFKDIAKLESNTVAAENVLLDGLVNTMYAAIETEKMFVGDPATFSSSEDMMKRIPQYTSTGDNLRNDFPADYRADDELMHSSNYNVAVSNDIIFKSEYAENLIDDFATLYVAAGLYSSVEEAKKQARTKLNALNKVNETDGQTYILPEMYRAIHNKLGEWGQGKEDAYNLLMYGTEIPLVDKLNALDIVMAPLKMQYLKVNVKNGQTYPIIDKMSLATLFPTLVEGTQLQDVYDRMNATGKYEGLQKIHQLKFKSAQKTGNTTAFDFYQDDKRKVMSDLSEIVVESQDFNFLRHQLNTTISHDADTLVGTQFKKIGLVDVALTEIYKHSDRLGYEIVAEIHDILNELSNYGKSDFMSDMGIGNNMSIIDKSSFINRLKDEAKKANLPSYIANSFRLDEKGNFYLEIDAFPGNNRWIQSRIISLIKKATADLRMPGDTFVQMSSAGLTSIETDTNQSDDRLKIYREDGFIEAKVSVGLFRNIIPNFNTLTHTERVTWLEENPEVTAIAYRIPTQGQNSEYVIKIKEFIEAEAGNVIILPAEGTAIGGFDYDIDKLYLIHHNYDRLGKKIEFLTDSNSTIEERYIKWIKSNTPSEIKAVIRSLREDEATAIKEKYRETIREINNRSYLDKEISNAALKETLDKDFKNLSDDFKNTEAGRELTYNFTVGKNIFAHLSLNTKQLYWNEAERLDTLKIVGADRAQAFKDISDILLTKNISLLDKEIIGDMIDLYNEQLNLFGRKDDFIANRKDALLKEFNDVKNPMNEEFDEDRYNAIQSEYAGRSEEFKEFQLQEATEFAEQAGFPSLKEFENINILNQNTKKALQNKLVDNYAEIYLDPKHKIFRNQPLEYGTQQMSKLAKDVADKEGVTKRFEEVPFGTLTPVYQLEMKARYKLGKNLSTVALANAHHGISQFVSLGLFDNIGVGNTTIYKGKTVTDLSKTYSLKETTSEGVVMEMPITEWLSSLINGHVDLPTDPYVVHLNINGETIDTVLLLVRAGMGMTTFKFSSQPILKEYAKRVENRGNKINVKISNSYRDLIDEYNDKLVEKVDITELENNILKEMKDVFNPKNLMEDIGLDKESATHESILRQIKVLVAYNKLQPYANSLKEAVLSSRDDAKKIGSSISQVMTYDLKREKVLETERLSNEIFKVKEEGNFGIRNFKDLTTATMLNKIHENGRSLINGVLAPIILEATPSFKRLVLEILNKTGRKYSATKEDINWIANEVYSTINAEFFKERSRLSSKDFNNLLYGTNSIPSKIYKIKSGQYLPSLKDNKLVRALLSVFDNREEIPDLTVFLKPDSKWTKESLNRAWATMYNSENEDEADFAVDLLYYSYLTSGFKNTLHSFHDLAPVEMLRDLGYNEFIKDKEIEYTENEAALLHKFDDIFFNGWRNETLVPEIKFNGNPEYGINHLTKDRTVFTTADQRLFRGYNDATERIFAPYVKLLIKNAKEGNRYIMYKYTGYLTDTKEAVYYAVEKKGYYNRGLNVREDILDKTNFGKYNSLPYLKDAQRKLLNDYSIPTHLSKTSSKFNTYVQIVDNNIKYYKELDRFVSELYAEEAVSTSDEVDPTRVNDPYGSETGGFSEVGRGTKEGDEKDAKMRESANAFIGEVVLPSSSELQVEEHKRLPGSTGTSAQTIATKQNTVVTHVYDGTQKGGHRHTVFTQVKNKGDNFTVMLARNNARKGYPLNDATKHNIKLAHEAGAKFIVGDMPGVDNRFILYLNDLGAEYKVYFGETNRLSKITKLNKKPTAEQKVDKPVVGDRSINIYSTGKFGHLSNFTKRPFKQGTESFNSVEEYYQLQKAKFLDEKFNYQVNAKEYSEFVDNNQKVATAIKEAASKGESWKVKALASEKGYKGLKYQGIDWSSWNAHKADVMFNGMLDSFLQNEKAADLLVETKDATITHNFEKGGRVDDGTFAETIMKVRELIKEDQDSSNKEKCNG